MRAEAWMFAATAMFLTAASPLYWILSEDWTGTAMLVMTTLLAGMVALYLGFHASRMDRRPEDRKDAEIADGAGELGFFPPYSWWPLWCGLSLATMVFGTAHAAWWLVLLGGTMGALALAGLVFEYYRGIHAH